MLAAVEAADVLLCFRDYFWFAYSDFVDDFYDRIEQKLSTGAPFFLPFIRLLEGPTSPQRLRSVERFLQRLKILPTFNKVFSFVDAHPDHDSGGSCWFRSGDGCLMNPQILGGVDKVLISSASEIDYLDDVFPLIQTDFRQLEVRTYCFDTIISAEKAAWHYITISRWNLART